MGIGKLVLLTVALQLAAVSSLNAQASPLESGKGVVVHVFDGDTILVTVDGARRKVRLLGIDAPEKEGPYTHAEPLGQEAGRRAARLALNKQVTLLFEGETLMDKYGRLLAHVILPDGRTLNEIMLKEGYAEAYRKFNYSRKKRYRELEKKAKAACLGIWKIRLESCRKQY